VAATHDDDQILRFRLSERRLHWALALPFMISWTTALVLVTVYNPHPERPYRFIFSWIHRASGVWLSVLPTYTVITHRREFRLYLQNIREAWSWRIDDLKWLALMGPAAVSSKVTLPDQGKFNAAEKINFMSLTCTYPAYIVTGVLIWLPGVALLAWLVHFSLALLATPLILGHIFMATVNPETRVGLSGMFTGFVSREWAKHHYTRWYRDMFEPVPQAAKARQASGVTVTPEVVPIEHPAVSLERPAVSIERPAVSVARPAASIERPAVSVARPPASIERPAVSVARPPASIERPAAAPAGVVATAQ
jgi:formate dehydrogenase subunit gamma